MTRHSSTAFIASASLHAGILGLLFLGYSLVSRPITITPAVFQIVPDWFGSTSAAPTTPTSDSPSLVVKVPVVVPPIARAVPTIAREPAVAPANPAIKPDLTSSSSRRISEEEFLRQHPRRSTAAEPPAAHARVDPAAITRELTAPSTSTLGDSASGAKADEITRYLTTLKQRLKDELGASSEWADQLRVTAEFQILPNGRLAAAKIIEASSNSSLDAAVLRAIAHVQMAPPPEGLERTLRVPIIVREMGL